jgi:hypothetical protein
MPIVCLSLYIYSYMYIWTNVHVYSMSKCVAHYRLNGWTNSIHVQYCYVFRGVTIDGVWIGEWIYLYTALGTTNNYSAIVNLHTLQITTAHAKTFSSLLCLEQPLPSNCF